jgi:hypothetical protein
MAEFPVITPEKINQGVYVGQPPAFLGEETINVVEKGSVFYGSPIHFPSLMEDPFQPGTAEDPVKQGYGMIPYQSFMPPGLKERFEVVRSRIGRIKLRQGRLDQADYQNPSFNRKLGQ